MCARPRGPQASDQPRDPNRQAELAAEFINHLGGENCITPWERHDIARAATLQSVAEHLRRKINSKGAAASYDEIIPVVQLEELARDAVEKLRLVCHKSFNPREDYNRETQNK
jgi:hypothetical protein